MRISANQSKRLLELVFTANSDSIDCDGCLRAMAEFVEFELRGQQIPVAMSKVQRHLQQCMCCQDEHEALLQALKSFDG